MDCTLGLGPLPEVTLLFLNVLVFAAVVVVAFLIVWAFLRVFVGFPIGSGERKWAIPAAGAGFFLLVAALITTFLPLEGGRDRNILVQNTTYGALEVDIDRLFSDPTAGVPSITSDFFIAPDSSFFLRLPPGPGWLVQVDSTPALETAIRIQTSANDRNARDIIPVLLGLPRLSDSALDRFCLAENRVQEVLVKPSSTVGGVRVDFNPNTQRAFWRYVVGKLQEIAELVPSITEEELAEVRQTPAWELDRMADDIFVEMRSMWSVAPKETAVEFRNSLCIVSIDRRDFRSELISVLDLPDRTATLMSAASRLMFVIPGFSLAGIETLEISRDSRAMLGRSPILLEDVGFLEDAQSRLTIEQLQLVALGPDAVFFVQLQFLVAPGEGLLAWREIQDALRSLRFLENGDASVSAAAR